MATLETIRDYMNNNSVTLNELNQVRLEETSQTLGQVFESEEEVTEHLRTICLDNGNEWNGIDASELYDTPEQLRDGLKYIGKNVWYQQY